MKKVVQSIIYMCKLISDRNFVKLCFNKITDYHIIMYLLKDIISNISLFFSLPPTNYVLQEHRPFCAQTVASASSLNFPFWLI